MQNGGADNIPEYGLRTMLPQVEGEQWKRIRSHMSPTFSTGKLKKVGRIKIVKCCYSKERMNECLKDNSTMDREKPK